MRFRGVVVFLRGLGVDLGRDGDGLLGAAGGRVLSRGEDLGRSRSRAMESAGGGSGSCRCGGALRPVVAVGVIGGDLAELVAGGLGGLRVVRGGLFSGRAGGQRPEFQQGRAQPGSTGSRWR